MDTAEATPAELIQYYKIGYYSACETRKFLTQCLGLADSLYATLQTTQAELREVKESLQDAVSKYKNMSHDLSRTQGDLARLKHQMREMEGLHVCCWVQ